MILEALYHGMIHPEETYHPMTEEHRKRRKEMNEKQEAVMKRLDAEGQRELEDLLDELGILEAMQMEEIYTQGMRMGAQLVAELLDRRCK